VKTRKCDFVRKEMQMTGHKTRSVFERTTS
jgi:hypothetical protein